MIARWLAPALLLASIACAGSVQPATVAGPSGGPTAVAERSVLPNAGGSVKFLVIGDSGTGGSAQRQLAERMVEARARFPFEFAIMLGDNLYGGENPRDYYNKFERPYKALLDAEVKFYASLGNHDEPAQRFYRLFNMGGDRYYKFSKGGVDFFALDSTYMTPAQLKWVERELAASRAAWKIAYMHHPMYSSGERHGSEIDLRRRLEPLFLKHGVDVVFAGHEHFYERLRPQQGIQYITQGAAAKLRRGNIADRSALTEKGFDTDYSFTIVEIEGDKMFLETISRSGAIVDSAVVPRRERATTTQQPR